MWNAMLHASETGIKIARRNINNFRYADDTTLMAESKEELKNFLMRVKEQSEKVGLKLNIQKSKIMASSPITSWQVEQGKLETVTDFIFLGSKITADVDCIHEIKRCLLLRRKAMTNLDSRDMHLLTMIHIVTTMVFPNVMYGCESWTVREAEHQRIDAFELWCWRRLFQVFWIARISNKLILKENQPWISTGRTDAEAEALILWPPDVMSPLIGKDADAGKDWRQEKVWQRMRWLDGITNWTNVSLSKLREIVKDRDPGVLQSMDLQS